MVKLLIIFFLFLYSILALANNETWNCAQVAGEKWLCEGQVPANTIKPDSTLLPTQPKISHKPDKNCLGCNLTSADNSKNKIKTVAELEDSSWFLVPAFNFKQEQIFAKLYSKSSYNFQKNCSAPIPKYNQAEFDKSLRDVAPISVKSDYFEVFDKEITGFFGNVEVIRADQTITSNTAHYDTISKSLDMQGNIFYNENKLAIYADTSLLNLTTNESRLRNALFVFPSSPIRGSADVIYQDSKDLFRYKNTSFTSCPPGNRDWIIHAKRLKINRYSGKASAKNAWLEFKGIPFLYTPYISLPIDDRRLSGFLPPNFGNSSDNGLDFASSYYWNIAPNYDLIISPRYLSKRGAMLNGKFRYLNKTSESALGLEILPYDKLNKEPRYLASLQNKIQFSSQINTELDLNYISDDEYFDDLSNTLDINTDRYLESNAELNYKNNMVDFLVRLQAYQTIDEIQKTKPYQKLPQTFLNLHYSLDQLPVDLTMHNEYVNFYRSGDVNGHRINLRPSIAFTLKNSGYFFKPKLSLQHTEYILDDKKYIKDKNISRTLPIFSVDSGLFFEHNYVDFNYLHTIEPRAFYLYIPEKNQDNIPDFDTALYDFNFASLFRENRFSGTDRVQDANQISLAITSKLINTNDGQQRLKLSVGEIFYFSDRKVTLRKEDKTSSNLSNVVAELTGQLTEHLAFSSGVQWGHKHDKITRGQVSLQYKRQPKQIINLGYRYRRDNPESEATIIQTNIGLYWPLIDNWFGIGRWQYSLQLNSTTESFLGLEKESCCWRFRVLYRSFADANNKTDDGFFIQLELKGLSGFGDKVGKFLEKNLQGYEREK